MRNSLFGDLVAEAVKQRKQNNAILGPSEASYTALGFAKVPPRLLVSMDLVGGHAFLGAELSVDHLSLQV